MLRFQFQVWDPHFNFQHQTVTKDTQVPCDAGVVNSHPSGASVCIVTIDLFDI